MSTFSVSFRDANGVRILDLHGELDAHTASDLEESIQQCHAEGNINLLINGTDLDYISSAGLGVFMAYVEEIRDDGGDIKIAGLQSKVYNVFDLLGFPVLFDICETEEEALARFEEPAPDAGNASS